jgi:hypothetical protein
MKDNSTTGKTSAEPAEKEHESDNSGAPRANPVSLPAELPDRWLVQLREVQAKDRKQAILTSIAGSTVLATVIGVFASFFVESYKAGLNRNNEISRLELEYQKKHEAEQANINLQYKKLGVDEQRRALEDLASQVRAFENELDVYIGICKRAVEHPQVDYTAPATQSLVTLLDQIGKANDAARNSQIAQEEISKRVQKVTGGVNINLASVINNPKVNPKLIQEEEQLHKEIREIKEAIESQKQSLNLKQ